MTFIPLRNKGLVVAYARVDPEDYERLAANPWRLHKTGYAYYNKKIDGKTESFWMQKEIVGEPKGSDSMVDHINENRLDNRRRNLRLLDRLTNGFRGTGPNYPEPDARHPNGAGWNEGEWLERLRVMNDLPKVPL